MNNYDLMGNDDLIQAMILREERLEYARKTHNLILVGELEDQIQRLSLYLQS